MRQSPFVHIIILFAFIINTFSSIPTAQAQDLFLPQPGVRVHLSQPINPPILKGIKVHPDHPFKFDFILDQGDNKSNVETQHAASLQEQSIRMIKYFLASLTIPEKDLWVNLSPYEKDRIIPESFGQTEMGRDLLAQDYLLKQITASLMYPEDDIGKKFWTRIYEEAQKKYGNTNIPVNTFNKVWIVPEKAVVFESKDSAYVVESRLKVLLEEDYLALEKGTASKGAFEESKETNKLSADVVRDVVIPILEKEVNEGKNFAQLRQVYHSLILAIWFKDKIKESIFGKAYVDQMKTDGIDIADKAAKDKIWAKYVESFKKGAYNYIKEDIDPVTHKTVPRKYFSGGASLFLTRGILERSHNKTKLPQGVSDRAMVIETNFKPIQSIEEDRQIQEGLGRLKTLATDHPEDSNYLHALGELLPDIISRKKTHVVNVVENAYRFINFNDQDVEYFFSRMKEVQLKGNSWSVKQRAERLAAYRKELSKVRYLYSQLPSEYQRILVPLAIFHDIGSLSSQGDKHWRGQGILDLDSYDAARDWVHHGIGAAMIPKLGVVSQKDVNLLETLVFHHGAMANIGIDFFKEDILNKFDKPLRDLLLVFSIIDMSGRQDGVNAANEILINAFIKNAEEFPQWKDGVFVARRISKAFAPSSVSLKERSKWLSAVTSYFKSSGRYGELVKNWKRVRVNQFDLFLRLARISPDAYAQLLAQISDEVSRLGGNDDVTIDTDIDFLGKPFREGRDMERTELTNVVYNRIQSRKPVLFKVKELPILDFQLNDNSKSDKFKIGKKTIRVLELQLEQMKEDQKDNQKQADTNKAMISDKEGNKIKRNSLEDLAQFSVIKWEEIGDNVQEFEKRLIAEAKSYGYPVNEDTKFILHVGDTVLSKKPGLEPSQYYRIFNHALHTAGINMIFLRANTDETELEQVLLLGRKSFRVKGFNITSPHKKASMNVLQLKDSEKDQTALIAGSVNGIVKNEDSTLRGLTSDGEGWVYWYTKYLGRSLAGKKIVILGAGGATRSLVMAITNKAPDARIWMTDIKLQNAQEIQRDVIAAKPAVAGNIFAVEVEAINDKIKDADLVLNFTGSGKSKSKDGNPIPEVDEEGNIIFPKIDIRLLKEKTVIDANYRFNYAGPKNEFLKQAESAGAEIYNGLGFLVGTIPPLYEAFTGKQVNFDDLMAFATDRNQLGLKEAGPVRRNVITNSVESDYAASWQAFNEEWQKAKTQPFRQDERKFDEELKYLFHFNPPDGTVARAQLRLKDLLPASIIEKIAWDDSSLPHASITYFTVDKNKQQLLQGETQEIFDTLFVDSHIKPFNIEARGIGLLNGVALFMPILIDEQTTAAIFSQQISFNKQTQKGPKFLRYMAHVTFGWITGVMDANEQSILLKAIDQIRNEIWGSDQVRSLSFSQRWFYRDRSKDRRVELKRYELTDDSDQAMISPEIIEIINRFGIEHPNNLQQLEGGVASLFKPVKFQLSDGATWVLRKIDKPREQVRFIASVMKRLREKGLPVPRLWSNSSASGKIEDNFVEHDGAFYVIEEFMTLGETVRVDDLKENHFKGIGQIAARINNALDEFVPDGNKFYLSGEEQVLKYEESINNFYKNLDSFKGDVDLIKHMRDNESFILEQINIFKRQFDSTKLPRGIIFNDMHAGNLKFSKEGEVVGIVDFDFLQSDIRVAEFNNMILGRDTLFSVLPYSYNKFKMMLDAYNDKARMMLSEQEVKAIIEILRLRMIQEIFRRFTDKGFYLPINAFEHSDHKRFAVGAIEIFKQFVKDFSQISDLGGIDLSHAKMKIQTGSSENPVQFNFNQAMLEQLQDATGFIPIIINIKPMTNLQEFLGVGAQEAASVTSG